MDEEEKSFPEGNGFFVEAIYYQLIIIRYCSFYFNLLTTFFSALRKSNSVSVSINIGDAPNFAPANFKESDNGEINKGIFKEIRLVFIVTQCNAVQHRISRRNRQRRQH
ncbi:hypothetical protein [Chitinophaga sp.]|uniref:hypothetical protein n=1 Tax=Chitinophaga sp. TaxID=1869181 RepID=UPI002CB36B6E|nr:hypothetical protein [Chitinophaga sp.]HWV68640.1 hypothetical protein [Chitinophaga sp.]